MSVPTKERRKAIIYRSDGSTTVVQASAIRNVEELAYALGFLAHHRLYKMSKSGGVTVEKAQAVADAFVLAAEEFQANVIDRVVGKEPEDRLSDLGARKVVNPFMFI